MAKSKTVPHGNAKKHQNLHAEMSKGAAAIYDQNVGEKGGNHLIGIQDNFATPSGGRATSNYRS